MGYSGESNRYATVTAMEQVHTVETENRHKQRDKALEVRHNLPFFLVS